MIDNCSFELNDKPMSSFKMALRHFQHFPV